MSAKNVKATDCKRSFGFKKLSNQQGNMMLPILGIFLMIGIMLQSSELVRIAQTNSITANARIRDSRNALSLFLSRYSALPAAYRNSVVKSENADLQSCVLGSATNLCYADGREYPMNLYAPSVDGAPAKLLAGAGVGTQAQPVLYNNKGQLCETGAKSASVACPFEVTSSFKATCAGGATSCAKADTIFIQYKIHTPENLYSDSFVKNRLVLATIENTAASVAVKNILPPSYDYVPNSVTVVSYVTNTTSSPASASATTYEQAYAAVLAAIGGIDTALATTITNFLYKYEGLTNLETLTALAKIWTQNASVAKRMADVISYGVLHVNNYVTPTGAQLAVMAQVPLEQTNTLIAMAVAARMSTDLVLERALASTLTNITDYQSMQVIVDANITNVVQANLIQTALLSSKLVGNAAYIFGEWVAAKNITDVAYATTIATVLSSSGATGDVAWSIVNQGITDLNVAKQMVAAAGGTTTTTVATTTTPTTTTSTTSTQTVTTSTTTASTVPVTMTAACTSAVDCGTTIGM